jgi:hypothetical protein
MEHMSQAAADLLFLGLDHGIDSVRAGGGPLTPFVIVQHGADRVLTRFVADRLEDGIERAVAHLRATELSGDDCAVLVYDGYLTGPEGRFDAIYAELLDGAGTITVIGQRYRPGAMLRRFETIGNPAMLPPGVRGKL